MSQVLGYRERMRPEPGRSGRWGVFNIDADRWLDVDYGCETEAKRAAAFLTKARVR